MSGIQVLQTLIDKQDGFEIVRDQIACILAEETANQVALANLAGKDPSEWHMDIYAERSNPWEKYLNQKTDQTPIVNVWYDNSDFPGERGDTVKMQQATGTINIDVYGLGVSKNNPSGGHIAGDKDASLTAQRGMRLVRNILMADTNTYLQLRGFVGQRWPQSVQSFQPELEERPVEKIIGLRLALAVRFLETSPQYVPVPLETITVDVKRDSDGKVIAQAEYDYT